MKKSELRRALKATTSSVLHPKIANILVDHIMQDLDELGMCPPPINIDVNDEYGNRVAIFKKHVWESEDE